ncbi:MAG: hypothetical protein H7X95_04300, partial [Deltaproteobacteria bacterium]|nr:hypothetical protein [Deltaproteobacteria bacterium]
MIQTCQPRQSRHSSFAVSMGGATSALCVLFELAPLAGGCASSWGSGRGGRGSVTTETRAGWTALVDGRHGEATSSFASALARDPGDPFALFGDAALAFERADSARALAAYMTLIERAAAPSAGRSTFEEGTGRLAAMALGRVAVLLDEFGDAPAARHAVEDRLLALTPTRLPWEARQELALLTDGVARRRGDVRLLARAAETAGCVRTFEIARPTGILPHLDLDAAAPDPAARSGAASHRTIRSVGCVIGIPAFDGRPGAQRVFADIDVPEDQRNRKAAHSPYDVILSFRGEARVSVDGGVPAKHGNETAYGPRVSATRVVLSGGRHRLHLRLATFGGHPDLVVLVIPAQDVTTTDPMLAAASALPSTTAKGDPI